MSLYTMNTHAQYVNSDNTCHTKIEDEEKKKKKKKENSKMKSEFGPETRLRKHCYSILEKWLFCGAQNNNKHKHYYCLRKPWPLGTLGRDNGSYS